MTPRKQHRPEEPHCSFTIPSIHDDLTLDCRIYLPSVLSEFEDEQRQQWKRRGIIMAHPYAPMGGSYDDRVVGIVVDEFLEAGWIVGTFNFRGAHGSKGRTSWSGRPESDDYTSFAAFFIHYMSHLRPFPTSDVSATPEQSPISPQSRVGSGLAQNVDASSQVTLGGYSYGSLILRHLPPLPSILQPFSPPLEGSAAAEILLRARSVAEQTNCEWITLAQDAKSRHRKKHETKHSLTVGGEETSPQQRRPSREIRRSHEGSRGLDIKTRLRSLSHRRQEHEVPSTPTQEQENTTFVMPSIRYLLVSPLTPPTSTLAAPALGPKFWNRSKDDHQEVIGKHHTLAVYGDHDMFSSAKRIRDWAEQHSAKPDSQFRGVEITGAGHFWVEEGVEEKLRSALRDWAHEDGT